MKTSYLLFLFLIIAGQSLAAYSNNEKTAEDSATPVKHSFAKLGVGYFSDNIYLGRKAAEVQSIIMPSIGYFHKSGLYASFGAGYIPNPGYQRFDMKQIEAGYEYSHKNFYGSAAYAKYIFNDSSNAINSSVSNVIQLYGDYDFNFVSLGAGFDIAFGTTPDIIFNPGLSHSFYLNRDRLVISPSLQLFAGTQNFYQSYFNPAKGHGHATSHGKGHNNNGSSGTTGNATGNVQVVSFNKFQVMDYEISLPLEYTIKQFTFTAKPVYIIPVNPVTLVEDNVTVKENLKKSFLLEAGISFRLSHHT